MITFTYRDRGFVSGLRKLHAQAKNPRGLMMVMGREAGNQLKKHFREKDRTDASHLGQAGGRRQHFWLGVSRTVQAPKVAANGRSVVVSINHPAIAQKVFGGTIRPKRASMLAIPLIPEAYGRRPSVYEQETGNVLKPVKTGASIVLGTPGPNGIFMAVYALARSVDQDPDRTALPPEQEMQAAIIRRGQAYVMRQFNQQTA